MCSSAPTLSRSSLIERAFSERASDIHLEPQDGEMVVRMRIDGLLRRVLTVHPNCRAPSSRASRSWAA